jgi:predicted transcriptional regulator
LGRYRGSTENRIIAHLKSRREEGITQKEMYEFLGISKSYLSETLTALEEEGVIVRTLGPGSIKRIWSSRYYPFPISGVLRVGLLRSSEYLPVLHGVKKNAAVLKKKTHVYVYADAISLLSDLRAGVLEIAFAPLYTTAISSLTYADVRILHLIASGGASVFRSTLNRDQAWLSTEVSTMVLMLRNYLQDSNSISRLVPFSDPCTGMRKFQKGKYGNICIWEPFASELRGKASVVELATYQELLGELPCCGVVTRSSLVHEVKDVVTGTGEIAYDVSDIKDIGFCGYEKDVGESMGHYNFDIDRSFAAFTRYLNKLGITVPVKSARILYTGPLK